MSRNVLLVLSVLFIAAAIVLYLTPSNKVDPDVLARIGDTMIRVGDVTGNPDKIEADLERRLERKPTAEELSKEIERRQDVMLASRVMREVRKQALEEFGLTVDSAELLAAAPQLRDDPEGVLKRELELRSSRVAALREAVENPADEKAIYEEHLAGKMDYNRWKMDFEYHRQFPQQIDLIEQHMPASVDDIIKGYEALLRPIMLDQKLQAHVTRDVQAEDDEVEAFHRLVVSKQIEDETAKPVELDDNFHQAYLSRKRAEVFGQWWRVRIAKNVRFRDEEIRDRFIRVTGLFRIPPEKE